jgi:hypothetical protein
MKVIKYTLLILLLLPLAAAHEYSRKTGKEKVTVSLTRKKEISQKPKFLALKSDGLIIFGIELAVSATQEFLSKEAEKYTQEYKGKLGEIDFLKNDGSLNYDGLRINREVLLDEKDKSKKLAADFNFQFELSKNKNTFRIIPQKPVVYYAKCKTKNGDDDIDAKVNIVMEAVWTKDGEPKKQIVFDESFDFTDLKLNGDIKTPNLSDLKPGESIVFPNTLIPDIESWNKGKIELELKKDEADLPGKGGWIPIFPKDAAFNIRCMVIESDDYGKRFEKAQALIKDNRDYLSGLLEAAFKKE